MPKLYSIEKRKVFHEICAGSIFSRKNPDSILVCHFDQREKATPTSSSSQVVGGVSPSFLRQIETEETENNSLSLQHGVGAQLMDMGKRVNTHPEQRNIQKNNSRPHIPAHFLSLHHTRHPSWGIQLHLCLVFFIPNSSHRSPHQIVLKRSTNTSEISSPPSGERTTTFESSSTKIFPGRKSGEGEQARMGITG
jgi:hypothetical protein